MLVYKLLDHSTRCESYLTLLENLIWNLDLNLFQNIWVGQFLFNGKFNHYQLLWLAVIWFFSWDLTFPFLSQSFTSIVGPNGSGKSNVIDSMLFVFGFRANKIRSKKISVLIHDSENHKNLDFCTVGVHFQKIIDTGVSSLNLTMSPFHWTVSLSNPYQHLNLIIAYVNIIFPKLLNWTPFILMMKYSLLKRPDILLTGWREWLHSGFWLTVCRLAYGTPRQQLVLHSRW